MRKPAAILFLSLLAFLFLAAPAPAASDPKDDRGSSDHPLFTRMPNTYIDSYETSRFDRYDFRDAQGNAVPVEGRLYKISYCVKKGVEPPSELQIIRNHANAVRKIGGTILFEDKTNAHFTVKKGDTETWAHLHPWNQGDCYTLAIVERQAMSQEVLADSKQMAADIGATGKVALYGIYFDTDKAQVKPESGPTLKEIAKFLKENPSMKIYVVGHTDGTGDFDHNRKLSEARAQAVVKELTGRHGVAAARLSGHGVGPLAPMAGNRTEEGRAKNRRVELVER